MLRKLVNQWGQNCLQMAGFVSQLHDSMILQKQINKFNT